ncbi:MAG: TIGR00341 family protein [Nitrospiraceae bacterium]|nr:MAG: TIGR00341 family protein [Nitrospiraceae bacterium]
MALRLIEVYHKRDKAEKLDLLLKDTPILETWHDHLQDGDSVTKILVKSEHTESIIDLIEKHFPREDSRRIVILSVEATIPRPEEPEEEKGDKPVKEKTPQRISIEELYQKMIELSGVSRKFIIMSTIASFVAALGLLKNDVAIIIGSMVIAPLLGPNMSLSLATTLADLKLAKKAVLTNMTGFSIVLSIGIIMGIFLDVDPGIPQISARSNVSHLYIFLALASGVAGAYSITTRVAEAFVGVMVAVAILPPLVAAGLLFGAACWMEGVGALLLCLVNLVCINLSGVITFLIEGVQPKRWWEAKIAKKAVTMAISIWIILLAFLVIMIFISQKMRL